MKTSDIASPDPAIDITTLPYTLCRTGHRYTHHRQDARFAVQLSKHVVHPFPPRSMLKYTAKDGPEYASLKQAHCIASDGLTRVHRGSPVESMCDITRIRCGLEVFCISADGEANSMHDSPEQIPWISLLVWLSEVTTIFSLLIKYVCFNARNLIKVN